MMTASVSVAGERGDVLGVTVDFPLETHHCRTSLMRGAPVTLPSIARGQTAPSPSHLTGLGQREVERGENVPSSFAQFLTSEEGQTTIALSMVPFPESGDCLRSVQSSVMH